jgi:hypothetical protein
LLFSVISKIRINQRVSLCFSTAKRRSIEFDRRRFFFGSSVGPQCPEPYRQFNCANCLQVWSNLSLRMEYQSQTEWFVNVDWGFWSDGSIEIDRPFLTRHRSCHSSNHRSTRRGIA